MYKAGVEILRRHMIKFTIVTSSLNAIELLESTATSILSQSIDNWEWIIVDGASSDGTNQWLQVLASSSANVKVISEPDCGIYDAWNKALPFVEGEWVLFLGAGDKLRSDTVLERCAKLLESVPLSLNLAYGRVALIDNVANTDGELCDQGWEGRTGPWGHGRPSTPNHQGIFHRASMFTEGRKFDTSYRIAGDTAFILPELLQHGGAALNLTIALMLKGGVSGKPEAKLQMLKEIFRINRQTGLARSRVYYQYPAFCYQYLKTIGTLGMRRLQHCFRQSALRH